MLAGVSALIWKHTQDEVQQQQAQQGTQEADLKAAADRLEALLASAPAHLRSECEQMVRACVDHN